MALETRSDKDSQGRFVKGNRAAIKSGCYGYIKGGKFPKIPGTKAIKKQLDELKKQLEQTIPELDVKSALLIDSIIKAHGFSLLFEAYARKLGIFSIKKGVIDYMPGFKVYQTFQNIMRHSIRQLIDQTHGNEKPMTIVELLEKEKKMEAKNEDRNNRRP